MLDFACSISFIFWKLYFQRIIWAIKKEFLSILRGVRFLLTVLAKILVSNTVGRICKLNPTLRLIYFVTCTWSEKVMINKVFLDRLWPWSGYVSWLSWLQLAAVGDVMWWLPIGPIGWVRTCQSSLRMELWAEEVVHCSQALIARYGDGRLHRPSKSIQESLGHLQSMVSFQRIWQVWIGIGRKSA